MRLNSSFVRYVIMILRDFLLTIWLLFVCSNPIVINNIHELYLLIFHDSFFIIFYSIYKTIMEKRCDTNSCNNYLFYMILIFCADFVIFTQTMPITINMYYYFSNFVVLSFPIFVTSLEIDVNNEKIKLIKQNADVFSVV
jgi:hypothetical protein